MPQSGLLAQLKEVSDALSAAAIEHSVIGGVAVNVHGYIRATHDLDLLVGHDPEPVRASLESLGYSALDVRDDIASFVRGTERIDILFARRDATRRMLADAERVGELAGIRVVAVEGLIGLKIQAFNDDPRRLRDLADIQELLRRHVREADLDEIRSYFRLLIRSPYSMTSSQGSALDQAIRRSLEAARAQPKRSAADQLTVAQHMAMTVSERITMMCELSRLGVAKRADDPDLRRPITGRDFRL